MQPPPAHGPFGWSLAQAQMEAPERAGDSGGVRQLGLAGPADPGRSLALALTAPRVRAPAHACGGSGCELVCP